ncbi:alpha/beta fold hydrolase [Hydrogenimonas cancrithermarum]|uniref:2-hydroxy-6-oxohepta-2,4-dienoate hydrolase n=1 Tax=Hydrogenimonas cancrithermarum TaxID=2993563 RepID=A0ABM8FHW4_9BACT|nr:alpha/beta hydrolase [Hydrogenimonas cancrithermarum]BDY11872.1 2-hydroxy-6-oxohepta-2,4-dienoate hydrolase [Hydrogenimonas cancrithermarum]
MAIKPIVYKNERFKLSYDMLNPSKEKTLLFLHGWGSNKELMKQAFGGSFPDYRHLYLDLPGFGKSENEAVLTTHDYAAIVSEFLETVKVRADVAIGHSFGGKVATLLQPERLILLSSAGIVMPKPLKVRAKIVLFKLLKPFGGDTLRELFVSSDASGMPRNMYETFKKVVDEDFSGTFAAFRSPALLCWGREDSATPPEAGRKIAGLIEGSRLEFFDGDHYFFLRQKDAVVKAMEKFLETV